MSKRQVFGKHYVVEFIDGDPKKMSRVEEVRPLLLNAVDKSGATRLSEHFHQFEPHGVTGMVFIAESHFSIHTWPEAGYAAFDVMTCGVMDAGKAIEVLREGFCARRVEVQMIERGID